MKEASQNGVWVAPPSQPAGKPPVPAVLVIPVLASVMHDNPEGKDLLARVQAASAKKVRVGLQMEL